MNTFHTLMTLLLSTGSAFGQSAAFWPLNVPASGGGIVTSGLTRHWDAFCAGVGTCSGNPGGTSIPDQQGSGDALAVSGSGATIISTSYQNTGGSANGCANNAWLQNTVALLSGSNSWTVQVVAGLVSDTVFYSFWSQGGAGVPGMIGRVDDSGNVINRFEGVADVSVGVSGFTGNVQLWTFRYDGTTGYVAMKGNTFNNAATVGTVTFNANAHNFVVGATYSLSDPICGNIYDILVYANTWLTDSQAFLTNYPALKAIWSARSITIQ